MERRAGGVERGNCCRGLRHRCCRGLRHRCCGGLRHRCCRGRCCHRKLVIVAGPFFGTDPIHANDQIHSIQKRPADASLVTHDKGFRTAASIPGTSIITARTGVHGGNQHKTRRVTDALTVAVKHHPSLLQRLAQCLQYIASKLRQFIEKQNTAMGEGYLTGHRKGAAAYHGRE